MKAASAFCRFFTVCIVVILLAGCFEHNTTNPQRAYKLWLGQEPDSSVHPIRAKYWQSAHWTKEYILYIEMTVSQKWWEEYKHENGFVSADWKKWPIHSDAPLWFQPSRRYQIWKLPDEDEGSRYFKDSLSDTLYIYEIQL